MHPQQEKNIATIQLDDIKKYVQQIRNLQIK